MTPALQRNGAHVQPVDLPCSCPAWYREEDTPHCELCVVERDAAYWEAMPDECDMDAKRAAA